MLKLLVERSRDENLMCICTPRLRSGYNPRLRSGDRPRRRSGCRPRLRSGCTRLRKLFVERSRDEKSNAYTPTPRLRSGYWPRLRSGYTRLANCSPSEAETRNSMHIHQPLGSARGAMLGSARGATLGSARGAITAAPSGWHHYYYSGAIELV
jgi:hypothetical protein